MNLSKIGQTSYEKEIPITKTIHRKTKKCCHPWCSNQIVDSKNKLQCEDPKCIATRDIILFEEKQKAKEEKKFRAKLRNVNLILEKDPKLDGQTILMQCKAQRYDGQCKNLFSIQYRKNQKTYPAFCEEHRNEFRRILWEKKV